MANEVTSSIISELYSNVVQSALYTFSEQAVIRPLVRNYDMSGTPGLTAQVPIYPTVSASDLTDGTDLTTNTAFNTSSVTMTAAERGVRVTLTDLAKETASEDVAAAIGRQIGDAMVNKVDGEIAALFPSFSNRVGAAGDAISAETIFKAAATLRANNARGPFYCVVHPYMAFDLKKQLAGAGNTNMVNPSNIGNNVLGSAVIGQLAGITILESNNVGKDINDSTSGTGNYVGLAFSEDAIGYMVKRNIRVESQRDASLRADEIIGSMAYNTAEIFDEYGVGILGKAAL
jgi:N4-gp56 family major capsid protein